jgi:hypothetical protein
VVVVERVVVVRRRVESKEKIRERRRGVDLSEVDFFNVFRYGLASCPVVFFAKVAALGCVAGFKRVHYILAFHGA